MRSTGTRKRLVVAGAVCALVGVGPPSAEAGVVRACSPVVTPYPGTRYADVDLTRIRANGVSCRGARRVARGAHRALALTPPPSGVRRFRWNGWRVVGDLRGSHDRYLAVRGGRRVRWIF